MAKKTAREDSPKSEDAGSSDPPMSSANPGTAQVPKSKTPRPQPSTTALIICRNKHWRYISSFHGPWLQLSPEVLESLANNNYNLPRPRPIDPAVFFDLLKVRKLVDDATNLAVRAASGVTSSSLNNASNGGNGLLGNGALGIGIGGGGGNAKLSRERKHRMREQATQKLSKAYHLDEIACSVATMQSASTLEDVAQLVLQRSPSNSDAKYVHFFHEKIPSRQLAECTSLQPLDEIIIDRPSEGEILRTRAVVKMFKEDFAGAARDLTEALAVTRYYHNQHKADRQQLQLEDSAHTDKQRSTRRKEDVRLDEKDHPSSLETQLLFHRAGAYLTIAFQHVSAALPRNMAMQTNGNKTDNMASSTNGGVVEMSTAEKEAHKRRLEYRKIVKKNAKHALRDYIAYLSNFDYTPGLPIGVADEFIRKVNQAGNGFRIPRLQHNRIMDLESNSSLNNGKLFDTLAPQEGISSLQRLKSSESRNTELPNLPPPVVHPMSALFSATPPADLPPYPATSTFLTTKQQANAAQRRDSARSILHQPESHEALTYHPLLTDALHSLLLCHCLLQTSPRELQRHAHMVARLTRVCDGYPIFQAARSPSRADWIDILRRSNNWIGLQQSWETLCAPTPLPGQHDTAQQKETPEQKMDRLKQQAVMEALEDDRVCDEATFHAAVMARQRRQEEEEAYRNEELANGASATAKEQPTRWAQEDGKEYLLSTERAHAIIRWVREAPISGEGTGAKRKKKKCAKPAVCGKANNIETLIDGLNVTEEDVVEKLEQI